MPETRGDLWLIRHGETQWTLSGAHTGRTNLPLTENGKRQALALRRQLAGRSFALVLTSPLDRARETCRLAGYADQAIVDPNLAEWCYGSYEGRTTAQILAERPNWSIWDQGPLGGETIDEVAARAEAVIARALTANGDVALFAHGHLLRILTARWLEMPPDAARRFALETGTISVLGYERDTRVIARWNWREGG
ncbi:MAG: histidine phosphatase family protein [Bryobacteraceae bacterium]